MLPNRQQGSRLADCAAFRLAGIAPRLEPALGDALCSRLGEKSAATRQG